MGERGRKGGDRAVEKRGKFDVSEGRRKRGDDVVERVCKFDVGDVGRFFWDFSGADFVRLEAHLLGANRNSGKKKELKEKRKNER